MPMIFKNKKNILLISLTVISIFITVLSITFYFKINNFSSNRVVEHINYLASDTLKGRLCGTTENKLAETYILDNFKDLGLLPYKESYTESFSIQYPKKLNFNPELNIIDSNSKNIIESFNYGVDYKDDGTNFRINDITFSSSDVAQKTDSYLLVKHKEDYVLFYAINDESFSFRSSFLSNFNYGLSIYMTKESLNKLITAIENGSIVNAKIPFSNSDATVNNVLGCIKGKNSSIDPIVISCHFDHVGTDSIGNVYYGALDNASGSSFVLELAHYIKSLGTPSRDIIFAAFNGEEFGCVGSTYFFNNNKNQLKNSTVYNFDMIGSFDGIPLCVMGGKEDTKDTSLIHDLSQILEDKDVYFNYIFEDSSDHMIFRKNDISAVTLIDNDLSRIHTPNDKVEFINKKAIDRAFSVISKELCGNYFSNPFIKYNTIIFISSLCTSTILIAIILKNKHKKVC